MIKCKHCDSPLDIEQAFCEYCGQPNEYFKKHREDMAEYEEEFRQTQTEVYNKTNKFLGKTVSIVIICILVFLNIGVFSLTTQTWKISSYLKEKSASANEKVHVEMLEKLESDENYIGLYAYYYDNYLYYNDNLSEYSVLIRFAEQYSNFYQYLMDCQLGPDSLDSYNHNIEFMTNSICYMIDMLAEEDYYIEGAYSDENVATMKNIFERTKDMLRAYAGFSDEQLDNLETNSKAQIMIMLEEGISYNEKEA